MKKLSDVDFLVALRDATCMIKDACEAHLEKIAPVEVRAIDMTKIQWVKATGEHGEYERSDDINNLEHKRLLQVLGEHSGRMTIGQHFLWTFTTGASIGRKLRKK